MITLMHTPAVPKAGSISSEALSLSRRAASMTCRAEIASNGDPRIDQPGQILSNPHARKRGPGGNITIRRDIQMKQRMTILLAAFATALFALNLHAQAPVITSEPQDRTVYVGSTYVILGVQASGQALKYQWYQGVSGDTNQPLIGLTSPNIGYTAPSNVGTYSLWVRVSNATAYVDSRTLIVTVAMPDPPAITSEPQDRTVYVGDTRVSLGVQASGQALSYQWYQGVSGDTNQPLSGYTSSSRSYYPPGIVGAYQYWVRVSNATAYVDSRTMTVTVLEPTRIPRFEPALAFGAVETNTTAQLSLLVWNDGNNPLTLSGLTPPAGFASSTSLPKTIQPGTSMAFPIAFSPVVKQIYGGVLTLASDKTSGPDSLQVSGEGTEASRILALSGPLDFGLVQLGRTSTRNWRVRNIGASPVPINGLSLPEGFVCIAPTNLAWGAEAEIAIKFSPTEARAYSGTATILADLTSGSNSVAVAGVGIEATGVVTVPDDQPTIAYGIDAAKNGDIVRVKPGTYGPLTSGEHRVHLASTYVETGDPATIAQTVIDGGGVGSVVEIGSEQNPIASITGFTLRNGTWGIEASAVSRWSSDYVALALTNNVIIGNSAGGILADSDGSVPGGLVSGRYTASVDLTLIGNTILSNQGPALKLHAVGDDYGSVRRYARIYCNGGRNLLTHNAGGIDGYSGYQSSIDARLDHDTCAFNGDTPLKWSGIYMTLTLVNSIVWSPEAYSVVVGDAATLVARGSLIGQAGTPLPGDGNFWADPRFVNAAAGDFELQPDSPCVDRGARIATTGGVAFRGAAPDVGAYECLTSPTSPDSSPRLQSSLFAGQMQLFLPRMAEGQYQFFGVSSLTSTNWVPVGEPFWVQEPLDGQGMAVPASSGQQFFRVVRLRDLPQSFSNLDFSQVETAGPNEAKLSGWEVSSYNDLIVLDTVCLGSQCISRHGKLTTTMDDWRPVVSPYGLCFQTGVAGSFIPIPASIQQRGIVPIGAQSIVIQSRVGKVPEISINGSQAAMSQQSLSATRVKITTSVAGYSGQEIVLKIASPEQAPQPSPEEAAYIEAIRFE